MFAWRSRVSQVFVNVEPFGPSRVNGEEKTQVLPERPKHVLRQRVRGGKAEKGAAAGRRRGRRRRGRRRSARRKEHRLTGRLRGSAARYRARVRVSGGSGRGDRVDRGRDGVFGNRGKLHATVRTDNRRQQLRGRVVRVGCALLP